MIDGTTKYNFCTPIILAKNVSLRSKASNAALSLGAFADQYLSLNSHAIKFESGKINLIKIDGYLWKNVIKIISYVATLLIFPALLMTKLMYRDFCKKLILKSGEVSAEKLAPKNNEKYEVLKNEVTAEILRPKNVRKKLKVLKNDKITKAEKMRSFIKKFKARIIEGDHAPRQPIKATVTQLPIQQIQEKAIPFQNEPVQAALPAQMNVLENPWPKNCPITGEPFEKPAILIEDGFTYEEEAINHWLELNPNNSPFLGAIPSATVCENRALMNIDKEPVCPLTNELYQEPYFCLEDGQTYEKSAIEKWFKTIALKMIRNHTFLPPADFKSPYGTPTRSLTLYPNKILFSINKKIPANQKPITISILINLYR